MINRLISVIKKLAIIITINDYNGTILSELRALAQASLER